MDYPFWSKEKGNDSLAFPRGWVEGMGVFSMNNGLWSTNLDDLSCNVVELMNLDAYAGWCNTPCTLSDQMYPPFALFPLIATSTTFSPFDGLNFTDQYHSVVDSDIIGSSFSNGDKVMLPQGDNLKNSTVDRVNSILRFSMHSLAERMLKALFLFMEWSGGGILAQVWVPMKNGDRYILSTSEQPYLLDQTLSGYREVSRLFTFAAESKPGFFLGLPGRVFTTKLPEWTSNVMYYSKAEYLRVQYAVDHKVRGSIALPVFDDDSLETSCCAVLELVTMKEMSDFDLEMENVCRALQSLSENQRAALAEITDVLRAVCHAHRLPLALTWIPCNYSDGETIRMSSGGCITSRNEKFVLYIEDAACYVNDENMHGFVHACTKHYLEEGQAFQFNRPFFYPDVKEYHISEYPLVHHARKFGLNAAFAIRLRSTYTCESDYILELFLPVDMRGSVEQHVLLNNLSSAMQRICKSLRTVSDAELLRTEDSKVELKNMLPISLSRRNSEQSLADGDFSYVGRLLQSVSESTNKEVEADCAHEQSILGSRKPMEKKRSTAEKHVSLSVLQQYFSGCLKDAAKSIGVCPTTLKRICRQHGISRWPSRKINKVNLSLRKIQSVLNSVEGVEGGLKFDPAVGGLVAAGSIIQELDLRKDFTLANKSSSIGNSDSIVPNAKSHMENEWASEFRPISRSSSSVAASDGMVTGSKDDIGIVDGLVECNQPISSGMADSYTGFGSRSMTNGCSSSSRNLQYPRAETKYGYIQLYEEIASRFNLLIGQFQLKYLDDENEWVMMVSDSDLHECIEMLNFPGTRTLKFIVRDVHSAVGSSSGSSGFF
ncbi:hypothetical protein CDL12_02645 [Handroanthus impetiginosus]|uniref:Uncharacterized protein n=1 Tax=Handroanthus impetiginosus TaxID=429701 RepID=A0A2G9I4D1_9LAMI|nr:hypothetical protein CDL12_02645 [Handroanthus impetiginosus]